MGVRPGYKPTDAGVIPEEWDNSTVGREFEIKLGKMLDAEKNVGVAKPYLGNKAVQWDRISISELPTVPMSRSDIERFRLRKGDLLVCEGGEVGRAAIWDAPIDECYYQKALHRLRPLRGFDSRIMAALLRLWAECGLLANYVTQTSIAHLPREKFMDVPMPVPPPPEQRAIAEALRDVDALLGALDRLIAKKSDFKQAAMQQLLTGRTRLPGFHLHWEVKRLGDLLTICHGRSQKNVQAEDGSYPILATGGQIGRAICYLYDEPSVLIGRKGTIDQPQYMDTPFWTVDTLFYSLIRDSNSAKFIFFRFCLIDWKKYNEASGVPSLNARTIENIEISCPEPDEQIAIAAVLSDMDAELTALERRREKTRALKRGMMQELLTGRTRLVSPIRSVPLPQAANTATPKPAHNWQINEAVVISVLTKHFGSDQWPLGRKRYTKLSYLLHRHAERQTQGYLKKAAGPYNPATKYKGPEGIALKNHYVRRHARDQFSGFVSFDNIAEAEGYFAQWYGNNVLTWLEQFRRKTNDDLELLTTVDMAMEDLRKSNLAVNLKAVKEVIHTHPEWEAKLSRPIFSDGNIKRAIGVCRNLFGS